MAQVVMVMEETQGEEVRAVAIAGELMVGEMVGEPTEAPRVVHVEAARVGTSGVVMMVGAAVEVARGVEARVAARVVEVRAMVAA